MRLLIIRHAIAVERGAPGIPDDERPLTPRGMRRFRSAARGLAALTPRPQALLSSPLLRARQTADLAAEAWGRVKVAELPALAGGDPEPLLDALEAYSRRRLVALVGHEPQLSSLLALLLGTRDAERLTFRKGGAALVDLPRGPRESGRLLWYLPPRLLRLF